MSKKGEIGLRHPNLIRGKMSVAECAEIERLASVMRKPTPGKIARAINRHPATVKWYMLTHGLIEQKPARCPRIYFRGGRAIHPYSEEHDRRLLELRSTHPDAPLRVIGELITAEFGIERNSHSVAVRLTLLAAAPDPFGVAA
jgi:hypothetical protein